MMVITRGLFLVLGVNPLEGVHCTGFVDVDCSWDLSLGHRIGDGKFDGKSFWVGCGWVFFVGRRGGEETPDHVQWGRFSFDDTCFQTVPFFMLYIIY